MSIHSLRLLGFGMAAATIVLTVLASLLTRHNPAVVAPLAMVLPFVTVVVLDGLVGERGRKA
jgi:F0F1-type ATP synthase membrane subunit a